MHVTPLLAASLLLVLPPVAQSAQVGPGPSAPRDHHGPVVPDGEGGPKRYVGPLYENFVASRAMRDAAYADQWYRTPGAPSYDATLDRMEARLREHGYGTDPRLKLRIIETEMPNPAWIPKSASLILRVDEHPPAVLHAFSHPSDHDRVMLPVNAPPADVEGRPVFSLDQIETGTVLVTEARVTRSVIRRAEKRGAVAILSSSLFPFTIDPTGAERHKKAILWTKVAAGTKMPVAYISPNVHSRIATAAAGDRPAWLTYVAEVEHGGSKLRTLVAEVVGSSLPKQAIAIASHVQEPGAGDNASGIAGLTESACVLSDLLRKEKLTWPKRTVAFIWGDEMKQSEAWLDEGRYEVIAGISADMLGQSTAETGAMPLLERAKDPGAIVTIEPDSHTPWGAGEVTDEDLVAPHGFSVIARAALVDVARHVGGWRTSENPWEGGSDHDVFLERGVPGILMWHFTDFTYHTSLDRMTMLDPEELRRTCTAVFATALAVADAGPEDLERYIAANELERELRVRAARAAGEDENAAAWTAWCDGAEKWLRALCGR
ncbi:MAG: M28 family peptidase [bacterium]|nr:M28 family peptidase [bacterium]